MNRQKVTDEFTKYVSDYNLSDVKIRLKYEHTFRVAEICDRISDSLGISKEQKDIAWLSGMLHDIGRFEQVRIYGTFRDVISVNHAELSADLLWKDGLKSRFEVPEGKYGKILERAIRCHNRYEIPSDLGDEEKMFCQIIRDADKVDILKVNCDFPITEIYDMPEKIFTESSITPEVFDCIMREENINRKYSHPGIDYPLGIIAFVFGMVYPESIRITMEKGYLDKLLDFRSTNPDTLEKLPLIREKVMTHMRRRVSEK